MPSSPSHMMTSATGSKCAECAGGIIDLGDELVCRMCGVVKRKEVVETKAGGPLQAIDFTGQALGGYLGPPDPGVRERFSPGFSTSSSTFRYLKLVSDYSGREDSAVYGCAKLTERVAEKLGLPRIVVGQAVTIAKTLFESDRTRSGSSTAVVSAYALATACKLLEINSSSVREIVEAYRLLGKRVKTSALIQLSLDSPFKASPRRPEDYVGKVVARLQSMPRLASSLHQARLEPEAYFAGLRRSALDVLRVIGDPERGGHSPCSLAATAVYAAEAGLARQGLRRRVLTQRDIAESGGVAEYTIRELYGRLFRVPTNRLHLSVTRSQVPIPLLQT